MKTLKQWEKSGLNLDEFITSGDRIDEALFNYLGETTSPKYLGDGFVQTGEASFEKFGVFYHMTAYEYIPDNYIYLGILPEFVQ